MDDYKQCNLQIVLISEKVCDTPLLSLTGYTAMDLNDLVDDFSKNMNATLDKLIDYYHKIIEFLILVFEGFESVMGSVSFFHTQFPHSF